MNEASGGGVNRTELAQRARPGMSPTQRSESRHRCSNGATKAPPWTTSWSRTAPSGISARALTPSRRTAPEGSSVIVVDNASPDGQLTSPGTIPPIRGCSRARGTLGFGGACNLALKASGADLLFFVNPDARLTRGTTAGLIAAIESDLSVAASGPRIDDPSGNLKAASAGFEPTLRSVLGHFLLLSRLPGVGRLFPPLQLPGGSPAQTVDWVGGAALMVRSDAFRSVGGFDPSIFLYMEDVDLCRRLRATGRTIRYEPRVAVEHDLGGSQGSEQSDALVRSVPPLRGAATWRAVRSRRQRTRGHRPRVPRRRPGVRKAGTRSEARTGRPHRGGLALGMRPPNRWPSTHETTVSRLWRCPRFSGSGRSSAWSFWAHARRTRYLVRWWPPWLRR